MRDWTIFRAFRRRGESPGAELKIEQVGSRRQRSQFLRLPWRIYAGDPQWVPQLLVDVKEFIDPRRHPFFRHGAATQFLATRDGQAVGRILVSDDPNYNAQHASNVGCFGLFESVDDQAVAHALLEAAAGWLRARGRSSMMGPIDYSTNYPVGLLVEGFDTPPRVMMNHHPPYYAGLLESWGLAKVKDLYAWWFEDPYDMVTQWRTRLERLIRRGRVTVRPFRLKDFEAEVVRCQSVYNGSRGANWGFVKLTEAEFRYLGKRIKQLAIPQQVYLAEIDGRPVGFSITLPDINEAIRPLNGRLTAFGLPIGLVRLLYRLPRVKAARMMVLDLLEDVRRRGIAEMLILATLDYGKNVIGYTGAELSWTLEDNRLVNRAIEAVGAKRYKTYRIYEKTIA
jgi:GNAT superfamily N-acetyltransferase